MPSIRILGQNKTTSFYSRHITSQTKGSQEMLPLSFTWDRKSSATLGGGFWPALSAQSQQLAVTRVGLSLTGVGLSPTQCMGTDTEAGDGDMGFVAHICISRANTHQAVSWAEPSAWEERVRSTYLWLRNATEFCQAVAELEVAELEWVVAPVLKGSHDFLTHPLHLTEQGKKKKGHCGVCKQPLTLHVTTLQPPTAKKSQRIISLQLNWSAKVHDFFGGDQLKKGWLHFIGCCGASTCAAQETAPPLSFSDFCTQTSRVEMRRLQHDGKEALQE